MKTVNLITMITVALAGPSAFARSNDSIVSSGSSCLNLRSKATSRSSVKSCVPSGSRVTVLKRSNGKWSYVQIGDQKGYLFNGYLRAAPAQEAPAESATSASQSEISPRLAARLAEIPTLRSALEAEQTSTPAAMSRGFSTASTSIDDSLRQSITPLSGGMDTFVRPPARSDDLGTGSVASTPSSANGNDLNALSWDVTRALETGEIGKSKGYSMQKVGWAKMGEDGSISVSYKTMHCTSATHAHFLKMMGELHKKGAIKLNSQSIAALNSARFRDAWNSNGYANGKLMEMLGGQNFKDIAQAKKGDFMKMDRSNGTGHTTIFSHMDGKKVCYWSANKGTRGLGVQCESMSGKTLTFSRITDLQGLQAGLDNLGNDLNSEPSLADVRRRGGHGFVKRNSLEFTQVASASPALTGSSSNGGTWASADREGNRRLASLENEGKK